MKVQSSAIRQWLVILVLLLIMSGCAQKPLTYTQYQITQPIPQYALNYAIQQMDKPYVWGGQGPDEFDCSGLIICAYTDALHSPIYLMNKRGEITNDVNADELYKFNVTPLNKDEVLSGDIVFITGDKERITHAGLFIGWKDNSTLELINASSYHGKVCVDEWPLNGTKRGQWIVGFGRLKIIQIKE